MHPDVRWRRRSPLLAAPVVLLLATVLGAAPVLAGQGWSLGISPSSIVAGSQADILVTVTNTSGNSGDGNRIGCVTVTAPADLTVVSARVASATSGHAWRVAASAGVAGSVTATAVSDASRLLGAPDGDSVVIRIRVVGSTVGSKSIKGVAANGIDCSAAFKQERAQGISVTPAGPTPTPTARPTPTPTARPTPTPTARPTPTPTPKPTPQPTAKPTPTPAPTARPTPKPTPTARPTPTPTAASTPAPAAPSTASPPPDPSITPGPSSPGPSTQPSPSATPQVPSAATPPVARPAPSPASGGTAGGRSPGFVTGNANARAAINLEGVAVSFTGQLFAWVVPGLLLSVPGLLVLLAVLIQLMVGAAWLPVVRRRLGAFGFRRGRTGRSPRG